MEKVAVRKKSTTYVLILNFRVSYLALSLFYYFADSLIITITKDIKVKISRPVIELPENYGRVNGFVVNKKVSLSNLNGYTVCSNVDVNGLYCTENEKEMLKGIMESGFYI